MLNLDTIGEDATPEPVAPIGLRAGRMVELAILFVCVPGLLALGLVHLPPLPVLWLASLYCACRLGRSGHLRLRDLGANRANPQEWRRILRTFALVGVALIALVRVFRPEALFAFPLRHPGNWLLVVALYPLLSVFPQEIIYRVFFFNRYQVLFGTGKGILLASSLAFAFTHLAFHNWVAVALTLPGGLLFAHSYRRTRTLLLVVCEHALYGCLVFSIGLGEFLAGAQPWLR